MVPGRGLFAPPERIEARPFSAREAAATVLETAIEVLQARGEPARASGCSARSSSASTDPGSSAGSSPRTTRRPTTSTTSAPSPTGAPSGTGPTSRRSARDLARPGAFDAVPGTLGAERSARSGAARARARESPTTEPRDPVERVVALVDNELHRADQRRVVEIEPGRWWLGDRRDREAAAIPLADRVEWAVYSLLSTGGPISKAAFIERITAMFSGPTSPTKPSSAPASRATAARPPRPAGLPPRGPPTPLERAE